jgi:hypothetical protein
MIGSIPSFETKYPFPCPRAVLATDHRLSIGDSVALSAAAGAGCQFLLSEDLQEGFTWRGVTIANPLSSARHELLAELLDDSTSAG